VFDPSPTYSEDDDSFNLFSGWNAKKRDGIPEEAYNLILWHIYAVLADKDVNVYHWYLDELAYKFQHPTQKTGHTFTFVSSQGAGKNTIIEWIGYELFGGLYCKIINDIDDLLGSFNSVLEGTMWMILDGCRSYGKQGEKMKNLITQTRTSINNKHINRYEIDQYCTFTTLTNDSSHLNLQHKDRRQFIAGCSDEYVGNVDYFNALHQQMETVDAVDGFYTMLMNRDLSHFNPHDHNFPKTKLYKEVLVESMDSIEEFASQLEWESYTHNGIKGRISNADFYDLYIRYCQEQGLVAYELTKFNRLKKKFVNVSNSGGRYISKK